MDVNGEIMMEDKESMINNYPVSHREVASYGQYAWINDTARVLDAQKIKWCLYKTDDFGYVIDSQNFGHEVRVERSKKNWSDHAVGKIHVGVMDGHTVFTDVVVRRGSIKFSAHRNVMGTKEEGNGDLMLSISSMIFMKFPKYAGYIRFQSVGKIIIGISLHVTADVPLIYGEEWESNLNNVYSGKYWKS
jgi:hypothetical protein